MPAPLPPTSGYTYAVEISADEAIAAGAEVKFSGDVFFYVTNFLAVPVGQSVPSGYYDRTARAWKATTTAAGADKNGTVIKITGTSGLMVTIDSGGVVTLSDAERSQLYQHIQQGTYKVGDELWRMPIDHLTPYDFNFGRQVALDLGPAAVSTPPETQCEHSVAGSIIGCESQSLGEVSAVAGSPFSLNYRSARTPLSNLGRRLRARIGAVPPDEQMTVSIALAGRTWSQTFGSGPTVFWDFTWDGLDAAGRPVVGSANATVYSSWSGSREYLVPVYAFGAYPNPALGSKPLTGSLIAGVGAGGQSVAHVRISSRRPSREARAA